MPVRKKRTSFLRILVYILAGIFFLFLIATIFNPYIRCSFGTRHDFARKQVEIISNALTFFNEDTRRYPTTDEGLNALMVNPGVEGWDGPYLKKAIPADPWKHPYNYQSPGTHGEYDIFTYGLDGTPGGEEENKDITSWE